MASRIPIELRAKIIVVVILVMSTVLVGGLVKLQVLDHAKHAEQSERNRIRVVPLIPQRGKVLDRNKRTIIENSTSYTLVVIPAEFSSDYNTRNITMQNLSNVLGLDTTLIQPRIDKTIVNRYLSVPVKRGISDTTRAILEEQSELFRGVSFQTEQARKYLTGLYTESFTGYVLEASREDAAERGKVNYRLLGIDYRLLGRLVGKEGVEKQYDQILRGREGTVYKEVSASGKVLGDYQGKDSVPVIYGADLELTIDLDLQQACVEVIDTSWRGAVVALDPGNGEVLALVSFPGYDANIFSSVIPDSVWRRISQDSTYRLLNRPLNGLYPPASTVKLITVGAALEKELITPKTTLSPCTGIFKLGKGYFGCWEPGGHGSLTAVHALEQSCDIFMYQLGLRLGVDELCSYFSKCGFGRPTGIDLPSESQGLVPNSQYYDSLYGENKWTRGLVLNLSIGQGELLVTPLQLAQFYCGLVNNGIAYRPHIVRLISYPDGSKIKIPTEVSLELPFSQPTIELLNESMRLVVEGEHGTARFLKNERYSIGGKTGTAENPHGEHHSWFVGVAPLEDPEIVVCVIVENAGHGSEVAAPVAGEIIARYMENKMTGADDTEVGSQQ